MSKVSYPKLHSIRFKNMDNVESINKNRWADQNPLSVIAEAAEIGFTAVTVVGWDADGKMKKLTSYGMRAQAVYDLNAAIHIYTTEG